MVEIVYYAAASLDGYIATRDGGIDWLPPIQPEGLDYGYGDFYASVDALLMGSRTYEQIQRQAEWPYKGKPTWVFTRRPLDLPEEASPGEARVTFTAERPETIVDTLALNRVKRAWIVGGGKLASSFRERGLIHSYGIGLVPAILGGGIPLLAPHGELEKLILTGCQSYPDGVTVLWYRKAES
ncbi:MAG: dihydrofolate reductase [Rhodospirillaceae bacterium]|nr:dihydrofolate reductase [Rhodospirillaceae bacterium]